MMAAETVPQLLAAAVARNPAAIALGDRGRRVTYGGLDRLSGRIAGALRDAGLAPRDRVAICLDKSVEAVASLYGIMRAGGIAVPMDPNGPPSRLARILAGSGAPFIVTDPAKAWRLAEGLDEHEVSALLLPAASGRGAFPTFAGAVLDEGAIEAARPVQESDRPHGQDIACILYTSGSTGGPKGVMIRHAAIAFFAEYARRYFRLLPGDVLAGHAPLHFDLTLFDLYAGAAAGAEVSLVPQGISFLAADLVDHVEAEEITVWQSVPSVLRLMNRQMKGGAFDRVRICVFAGEPYPAGELCELMGKAPETRFFNIYGSTEMNDVACYPVPRPLPPGPLPIGRPWGGGELMLLDEGGREIVSPGQAGELWVRGPTISPGYWGDPLRTAERFVQNPLHGLYPDPVYRTGDLALREADGTYRFAGRKDALVKIRGNRVDPGEVEAALREQEGIAAVAVVPVAGESGTIMLAGFLVAAAGAAVPEKALRRHCQARLPAYMVPQRFLWLDTLPRTSTGKIDRQALKQLAAEHVEPEQAWRAGELEALPGLEPG